MRNYVRAGFLLGGLAVLTLMGLPQEPLEARARGKGASEAPRPRLKLWDRVLYDRWKKADDLVVQAEKLLARRKYNAAAVRLHRAIRIRPYAAALWFGLGTAHSLAGRYGDCVKDLKRTRALDPKFRPNLVAFRLGLCLSLSNRIADGIQEYLKVKSGRWVKASIRNWNLADDYMALGRLTEAVRHYRLALRYNPAQRVLHFALAVALDRQGRRVAAARRMKRALQLDPKAAALESKDIIWLPAYDHHYYRALRFMVSGRRATALQHWQRFDQSAPRSPWRWVIHQRIQQMRSEPLTKTDLHDVTGDVNRDQAAQALTSHAPALRACLGTLPPRPTIASYRGVRLRCSLQGGRLHELRVTKRVGAVPAGVTACLQRALRRVPWRRVVKGRAPARFTLELIGP